MAHKMNATEVAAFQCVEACRYFILKVDMGRVGSTESYNQMKLSVAAYDKAVAEKKGD